MGTYLHGILDNEIFIEQLLQPFAERLHEQAAGQDYATFKELSTTSSPNISASTLIWSESISYLSDERRTRR